MDRPNPPPAAAILEGPEGLRAEDGLVRAGCFFRAVKVAGQRGAEDVVDQR